MNYLTTIIKQALPLSLAVFIVFGAVIMPTSSIKTVSAFDFPELPPPPPLPAPEIRTCDIEASAEVVAYGASVTISWVTQGFASVKINDQVVNPVGSGSVTFTNVQANTTYTLVAQTEDGRSNCVVSVTVLCLPPALPPNCEFWSERSQITAGESTTLLWQTQNAESVTLSGYGNVPFSGSRSTGVLTQNQTYTLTVLGENGETVTCHTSIVVIPVFIPAPTCVMTPTSVTINKNEQVTITWSTENAERTSLTTYGAVENSGSRVTGPHAASIQYTLTVLGENGETVNCHSVITVRETPPPTPVPTCDAFTATPSTIFKGNSSQLSWLTTNTNRVVINNGIGEVLATGTISVTPLATIEYTLTAYGAEGKSAVCKTTVIVEEEPVVPAPICVSFTATPSTLPVGGGTTTLSWTTNNATSASISPIIGLVSNSGTSTVNVASTTTYTLTVLGANNQQTSCAVVVTVLTPEPTPFTCQNNVNFSASPTRIDRGGDSVLTWSTNGVDSVSFDNGITATGLSGTVTVSPTSDTTYTLNATRGGVTIACPVSIDVESGGGGGGGGSSSPRCEMTISKNKITRGQEITLRFDTSRATEVELVDSRDRVLSTTRGLLSSEKSRFYDGELTLSPTQDTTYTLTAKRGSRERVCTVKVDVVDNVVVTQVRDQQPLIAGIALSEVPYTGFEAGPLLTLSFYLLLMAWALYVAYLIAIRRDILGGYGLARSHIVAPTPTPEEIRPDVFVASVSVPAVSTNLQIPGNLPVGAPVVGYASATSSSAAQSSIDDEVTALENHAHAKKALLSSDAIRHLISTVRDTDQRIASLNDIITLAKEQYPSEDGWVVINEKRMSELCLACQARPMQSTVAPFVPTVIPEGSGSLAEAIVTGNIMAAYEMIGHRPMFALADAAADLDAVYRGRKSGNVTGSTMLQTETAKLSDEQILEIIKALTSALDGVYTDEASAVKMAIMKAVKVVA